MPLFAIICDGGGAFGFGNLRRSATLGAEFKRRGYGVCVKAVSERARGLLPESPADQGEADLWLLDVPYNGDAWVAEGRRYSRPVAALDYEGNADPDLVISIFPRGTWQGGGASSGRHLVGLDYAIIAPAIATLSPAPPGHGVLVVIGGGDNQGLGERAALTLNERGCVVTLIEGPLAATTMQRLPPEIVRLSSPPDLARRMASCAWSVTGAGGAMLEMLCLGKPAHVLPRNPHEEALAQLVFQSGAVLGIGLETLGLPDAAACNAVSAQARSLVDGKGAGRIVDTVAGLL
jgi:spore coat polysaccharide biosynthesis predicted glycosyltransferase SpsG